MRRIFILLFLTLGLASCAAESKWAPTEEVTRAAYVHGGQPSITLFTVVSNSSGSGGHSSLMINGSQRLIFDPAGTWYHPSIPERNDVHFGMTNRAVDFYIDYHARVTWHVLRHEIPVSADVAERTLRLVQEYGAVPKAMCTSSISSILRQVPGFESLPSTMFPVPFMEAFRKLPGVTERIYRDDDPDNNDYMVAPAL